jgi:hypothetical protein
MLTGKALSLDHVTQKGGELIELKLTSMEIMQYTVGNVTRLYSMEV